MGVCGHNVLNHQRNRGYRASTKTPEGSGNVATGGARTSSPDATRGNRPVRTLAPAGAKEPRWCRGDANSNARYMRLTER